MSLVTLAFGNKNRASTGTGTHISVSTPSDRIARAMTKSENAKGEVLVRKACMFYGLDDIYVVAEVQDGFVCEGMKAFSNSNKEYELIALESKYGTNAKKGMTVGLTFKGISEEDFPIGSTIRLEKN